MGRASSLKSPTKSVFLKTFICAAMSCLACLAMAPGWWLCPAGDICPVAGDKCLVLVGYMGFAPVLCCSGDLSGLPHDLVHPAGPALGSLCAMGWVSSLAGSLGVNAGVANCSMDVQGQVCSCIPASSRSVILTWVVLFSHLIVVLVALLALSPWCHNTARITPLP